MSINREAVLLVPLLLLAGCGHREPPAQAETPQKIQVRRPNHVERFEEISASGTVDAKDTALASFQVAGQVLRVYTDEGAVVRAGQVLAELDPKDYDLHVAAAEAQAAAARANSHKAESAVRKQELEQAKIDLDRVTDEYTRYKALYERKSMAAVDFTKIEAAWRAAGERYSLALEGARQEDRDSARDAVQAAVAQEGIAKKALADTKLRAPINGVVARKDVSAGDMVGSGHPVFVIMNLNPAEVRVGIPEAEVGRVRAGQKATVEIPSLDEKRYEGRVELVGVAADPVSRTYTVKVAVPNPALELRAGMIAESRIQTADRIRATTIPAQAIVRDPQGALLVYVYYPEKNRVYSRRVDTGTVYGQEIEITRGLNGDEQVVIAGQHSLTEGRLVEAGEAR